MIRSLRVRVPISLIAIALLTGACDSSTTVTPQDTGVTGVTATGEPTGATGGTAASGATGVTGTIADACVLLTEADAAEVLAGPVTLVSDPIGEGLITGEPDSFTSVCYYRPEPDDFASYASLVVITPGSNTETEVELEASQGTPIEDLGDEAFVAGEQAVSVRVGETLFVVFVVRDATPDTTAEETIARRAVDRL
ncbi:MAG: hypothetical protein ACRDHC_09340 [Actinomycetota bacterium]